MREGSSLDDEGLRDDMSPALVQIGRTIRIGELARLTGKTARALHLYEELGLLDPASRSRGGFRLYSSSSVLRVRWIGQMKEMGFSLPEIKQVLGHWGEQHVGSHAMSFIRQIYQEKLRAAREQLSRVAELTKELERSVSYLDTCETCDPMHLVSDCPTCEVHAKDDVAPDLVVGIQSIKEEARG